MMRWIYAGGATLKGSSHTQNDDAIFHSENGPIDRNGFLALICDGVSSVPNGGWAARTARDSFKDLFSKAVDIESDFFIDGLIQINEHIRGMPRKKGACTLSLLWVKANIGHLISVGDSQVAVLRKKKLTFYTPNRNQGGGLSSFVGMKGDIKSHLYERIFEIQDEDLLLLMSDGVSEIVESNDFFYIWKHCYEDPQLCAERLVQLAQYSGSTDDNSAIVLHYKSEGF